MEDKYTVTEEMLVEAALILFIQWLDMCMNLSLSLSLSRSSQCSTTGVTKAVVCVILSVGWCI